MNTPLQELEARASKLLQDFYQTTVPPGDSPLLELVFVALTDDYGALAYRSETNPLPDEGWDTWTRLTAEDMKLQLQAVADVVEDNDLGPPHGDNVSKDELESWATSLVLAVVNHLGKRA